jgi:5'-methylthioadenosine phosphorylase
MRKAVLGIIGGSGLYQIEGLSDVEHVAVETPFGAPSDRIAVGVLRGTPVAFLPRHGAGHTIAPTEVNSRANIWALKSLGVTHVLAVNACGSLREELRPRDVVIPSQLIDFTRFRANTFFGRGIVAHIGFAEPFCPQFSRLVAEAARQVGTATVHEGATFLTIEGPRFSTRAESHMFRSWGADIIGMTASPEAQLAREAELCYASLALVTDYDVWHESEEPVSVEAVVANLRANTALAKQAIANLAAMFPIERTCACGEALRNAIITDPARIPEERKRELALLLGKYLR